MNHEIKEIAKKLFDLILDNDDICLNCKYYHKGLGCIKAQYDDEGNVVDYPRSHICFEGVTAFLSEGSDE